MYDVFIFMFNYLISFFSSLHNYLFGYVRTYIFNKSN